MSSVCIRPACAMLLASLVAAAASQPAKYTAQYLPGQLPYHQTGSAYQTTGWQVTVADKQDAYATYGPYATDVPVATDILVTFWLSVDNNAADDEAVVVIDVNDASSQRVIVNSTLVRSRFESPAVLQPFSLFFTTPATPIQLEYRVLYLCCAAVTHTLTQVTSLADNGTMAAFWSESAHFQFTSQAQFPSPNGESGMNVGFHFVPIGSTWYLFHRQYDFEPQPSYCAADYARIVVTTSTDRGASWSPATVVTTPVPNTPYECAIVDGAAHYDAVSNTWMYLGQCLARDEVWNMCLFTLDGASPLGAFTAFAGNPVVRSGQLWNSICGHSTSHCVSGSMGSEGTPEIVAQDAAGFYYVTFHGWDPAHGRSARGIAKTRDFVTWLTSGAALPGDAIFTSLDCNTWNINWASGGCVGGGEGTMLQSGDYRYHLIEAPDITLGCLTTPGQQNWVLGLSRGPASTFLPTAQWAPFSVVPTVVPAVKQGCYIQYHRLFSDEQGVYLSFWADGWLQIFSLTAGSGPLPIIAGPPPAVGNSTV